VIVQAHSDSARASDSMFVRWLCVRYKLFLQLRLRLRVSVKSADYFHSNPEPDSQTARQNDRTYERQTTRVPNLIALLPP